MSMMSMHEHEYEIDCSISLDQVHLSNYKTNLQFASRVVNLLIRFGDITRIGEARRRRELLVQRRRAQQIAPHEASRLHVQKRADAVEARQNPHWENERSSRLLDRADDERASADAQRFDDCETSRCHVLQSVQSPRVRLFGFLLLWRAYVCTRACLRQNVIKIACTQEPIDIRPRGQSPSRCPRASARASRGPSIREATCRRARAS